MHQEINKLILYTTLGCHLCEHAEQLLQEKGLAFESIDIACEAHLLKKFGVRIPVVKTKGGRELQWPFDGSMLRAFIDSGS